MIYKCHFFNDQKTCFLHFLRMTGLYPLLQLKKGGKLIKFPLHLDAPLPHTLMT